MIYMFAEKKTCFDVFCTCKATSLSKMAKLVWRYSDDARAIIENVYKFCMEEKKSGRKQSLNRVWAGLQHSLALADLPLRKFWKRRRRHMASSNSRHLPTKVSLGDFYQDHRQNVLLEEGSANP